MDQATLIEDIISTKNTLAILCQVFSVNRSTLQSFSSIFDSITELLDILTHSSVKQVEAALLSGESRFTFSKLKETLNELSEAITTKNTSKINYLNEQLQFSIQKLRIPSSGGINKEETADDIFKKNLVQPSVDRSTAFHSEPSIAVSEGLISAPVVSRKPKKEKASLPADPFAQFRFARRRHASNRAEDEEDDEVESSPSPSPPMTSFIEIPPSKPRLMISYNHASKSLCTDIYNSLTKDEYDVWIDLKQMHGSTLAAMAQAIEDSDIILYCVTQNYSQSMNCQKEAEYAFVRQKIMIPLLLQSGYKPTGWLGLLMGASLYIDFTKNDYTQNYAKLKSEIEGNASRINNNRNDVPKLTLNSTANDQQQSHEAGNHPPLQSTNTKSRGCVLL